MFQLSIQINNQHNNPHTHTHTLADQTSFLVPSPGLSFVLSSHSYSAAASHNIIYIQLVFEASE